MGKQDIIDKFLIKLEEIAITLEEEISRLKNEDDDYRYFNDLLEVLEVSKVAFSEGIATLKPKKLGELKEKLSKIISSEEVEEVIREASNLYYLSQSKMVDAEEVKPQKEKAMEVLKTLQEKLAKYLEGIKFYENEKRLQDLRKHLEEIINLGSKFEGDMLDTTLDEIELFQTILESVGLDDIEKDTLISIVIGKNVDTYRIRIDRKKDNRDIEIEEKDKEETTLSRMLFEEESNEIISDMLDEGSDVSQSVLDESIEEIKGYRR